jgi:hypothetical protein
MHKLRSSFVRLRRAACTFQSLLRCVCGCCALAQLFWQGCRLCSYPSHFSSGHYQRPAARRARAARLEFVELVTTTRAAKVVQRAWRGYYARLR